MLRILTAAALALALPVAAFAQGGGKEQMYDTVMNSPVAMGLELPAIEDLTDEQVSEMFTVIEGTDDEDTKQEKLKEIAGM